MTRDLRRHHTARRRKAEYAKLRRWWPTLSEEQLTEMVIKQGDLRTVCSCYMCGNRRKHEGPTIQERRHEQILR